MISHNIQYNLEEKRSIATTSGTSSETDSSDDSRKPPRHTSLLWSIPQRHSAGSVYSETLNTNEPIDSEKHAGDVGKFRVVVQVIVDRSILGDQIDLGEDVDGRHFEVDHGDQRGESSGDEYLRVGAVERIDEIHSHQLEMEESQQTRRGTPSFPSDSESALCYHWQ